MESSLNAPPAGSERGAILPSAPICIQTQSPQQSTTLTRCVSQAYSSPLPFLCRLEFDGKNAGEESPLGWKARKGVRRETSR